MKDFLDYDIKYPDLILRMLDFFEIGESQSDKTVGAFCGSFEVPAGEQKLQPEVVSRICKRMCERRIMMSSGAHGYGGLLDTYYCKPNANRKQVQNRDFYLHRYNSYVYGFEYIYRAYMPRTIPIIAQTENGQSMGSCFRIYGGIATARHCLTDGHPIAIRGYSKEQLSRFPVYVSENPGIDVAYILTGETYIFNEGEPRALDDVLVMGYPKVPMFLDFCTGEKANVSAMADLRLTPTRGAIAAEGEIYFPRNLPKVMLITAKIRGGNSGGPVINDEGYVVGIATGVPEGEGSSNDDVGYGMAYPIQVLDAVIRENHTIDVEFADFPD